MKSELRIDKISKAYFIKLGTGLMAILSLTLLYPLAFYLDTKYFTKRKYIDGKQLEFRGNVWDIYVIYLIGTFTTLALLSLINRLYYDYGMTLLASWWPRISSAITVGLIGFLITVQENKYVQQNAHFANQEQSESGYEVHVFWMIGKLTIVKILQVLSAGLLFPITMRIEYLYNYQRGYIDNTHFTYKFSLKKMYPRWFLDFFLIYISLGLYAPMAIIRIDKNCQTFVHIKKEN